MTVQPATAVFGECGGGQARQDTKSTLGKLGFPDGECSVGLMNPGIYPITITNTGIASDVYVNGTSQTEGLELTGPLFSSDESTQWTMTVTWTPVPDQG